MIINTKKIIENKYFNQCILDLTKSNKKNILTLNILANDFSHIYKKINNLFGSIALEKYLESILTMDRNNRQGFPLEVFKLLDDIKNYNSKFLNKREECVWNINNFN